MLVTLKPNEEKIKAYNRWMAELRQEHSDYAVIFKDVEDLDDVFLPYIKVHQDGWEGCTPIQEDYRQDYDGIYVCDFNSNYDLEHLTEYAESDPVDSPLFWSNYGVCDNASQVLDYYDTLYKQHEDYMKDRKFIILLTPIFRDSEPESGGWRWHKWGPYIGKFEHECEYIYDEKGIDYAYCFKILEVKEC